MDIKFLEGDTYIPKILAAPITSNNHLIGIVNEKWKGV